MDTDCRHCTGIARMRATIAPARGRSGSITSVPVCCLDEAERLSALAVETGRILTLTRMRDYSDGLDQSFGFEAGS